MDSLDVGIANDEIVVYWSLSGRLNIEKSNVIAVCTRTCVYAHVIACTCVYLPVRVFTSVYLFVTTSFEGSVNRSIGLSVAINEIQ